MTLFDLLERVCIVVPNVHLSGCEMTRAEEHKHSRCDGNISAINDLGPAAERVRSQGHIVPSAETSISFSCHNDAKPKKHPLEIQTSGSLSDSTGAKTSTRSVRSASVKRST